MAQLDNIDSERDSISRMLEELAVRGPDDECIATWDCALLGSRRLSIFDTSAAGRQPMVSADLAVGLALNGSVYNFRSLREELARVGAVFKSGADTEVLLQGYLHWGVDQLVSRLEGMFAFAIWDSRCRKMYLVRDRLGVKPLVYTSTSRQLKFASTPRALRAAGADKRIKPKAVLDFLDVGYVPGDQTIYESMQRVPAGSILEWINGSVSVRTYWVPRFSPQIRPRFDEAVDEAERLLLKAVEARLNADVPVGALLSGGVDSSLVCWAIHHLGGDVPTFTLGLPGKVGDETATAQQTAAELGLSNQVVAFSAGEEELDDLVGAYDEPFACASALGMLQLAKTARSSVTVLLTGDGGDEAFLGYPAHIRFYAAQRLARFLPPVAGSSWARLRRAVPDWGFFRRGSHFLDYATGGMVAVMQSNQRLEYFRRHKLFGERLLSADPGRIEFRASAASSRELVLNFQQYHFDTRFKGEFMTKVDESTMRYGIEARSPFFDRELWSFGHSLPIDLRLKNGKLKAVLREIVRRRISPGIANEPKQGFEIPVGLWLVRDWKSLFETTFDSSILERDGWLTKGSIMGRFRRAVSRGRAETELWHLFILERWLRNEEALNGRKIASRRLIPEIRCSPPGGLLTPREVPA